MAQQEGVVKYQLDFEVSDIQAEQWIFFQDMNHWRQRLFEHDLIGCHADRYAGAGYGNISHRIGGSDKFLISGTQTGHLTRLESEHYSLVLAADGQHNRLQAQGQVKPSSEALTHDAVYKVDSGIQCVMHVHDPLLWGRAEALGLSLTPASIEYGTAEMATAVASAVNESMDRGIRVIAMLGHEDGVLSYADSCDAAGHALLTARQQAECLAL